MKIAKILLAGLMAVTMAGSAACTLGSEDDKGDKNTQNTQSQNPHAGTRYTVTLELNGGTLKSGENIESYVAGTAVTLPTPTKEGYTFVGWYANSSFSGSAETGISADAFGNKTFYAKFDKNSTDNPSNPSGGSGNQGGESSNPSGGSGNQGGGSGQGDSGNTPAPQTYQVSFSLDGGTIAAGDMITSYVAGTEVTLPTPTKSGYSFKGWYENSSFSGSAITKIPATATGNKTYYAKWELINSSSATVISSCEGYEEGLYAEITPVSGLDDGDYKVYYKLHGGAAAWTAVDSQLVRSSGDVIRADVLGIAAGVYDVKTEAEGKAAAVKENITVTNYDRSGYAHFDATEGVGAYNNDGTPKNNAIIVYVNDSNKNTVTVNGISGKGIVNIIKNAKADHPLIVRVLGQISAATWKSIDYNSDGKYSSKNKLPESEVKGKNGSKLPTDNNLLTQEKLIDGGYNELDTSKYTELENLSSKIKYSSGEYDSAWNNCSISEVENVTVEGVGTDAKIFQWGFTWAKCNNIEVRNLTFEDYTEDACSFEGDQNASSLGEFNSKHLWVHHNTFLEGKNYWDVCPEQDKHEGDGATDFKGNAYVTVSYNHYYHNHKTGLVGSGNTSKSANITFHHNFYEDNNSRLPLARQANMHMYNNYYKGSTGTNMSLRAGAYAFIENCYFDAAKHPIVTEDTKINNVVYKGVAKIYNCVVDDGGKGSQYKFEDGNNLNVVDSRDEKVANDNTFNDTFDTDPVNFYYDATIKKTKTQTGYEMLDAEDVKTQIPLLAGARTKKQ